MKKYLIYILLLLVSYLSSEEIDPEIEVIRHSNYKFTYIIRLQNKVINFESMEWVDGLHAILSKDKKYFFIYGSPSNYSSLSIYRLKDKKLIQKFGVFNHSVKLENDKLFFSKLLFAGPITVAEEGYFLDGKIVKIRQYQRPVYDFGDPKNSIFNEYFHLTDSYLQKHLYYYFLGNNSKLYTASQYNSNLQFVLDRVENISSGRPTFSTSDSKKIISGLEYFQFLSFKNNDYSIRYDTFEALYLIALNYYNNNIISKSYFYQKINSFCDKAGIDSNARAVLFR